jgi:SAM-dependent methyltransferase
VGWDFLRGTYDAVADTYVSRFEDELDRKPRDRELLDGFAAAVGDPVLDVGCGPGHIGQYVQRRGRRTCGVDLSLEMSKRAAMRVGGASVGDMRALPIASGGVGGVVAFYSLIHIRRDEVISVLGEFHRVLRPGGRILLSVHEGQGEVELDEFVGQAVPFAATLFELDELSQACTRAGLDVIRAERREHYPEELTVRLYVEAARPGVTAARLD